MTSTSQQCCASSAPHFVSSLCWDLILEERNENYRLRNLLIGIRHDLFLVGKGWKTNQQIEQKINEELNGTLLHG